MNYLSYLEGIFNTYSNEYIITEEINYQYNGSGNAIIIKYLSGTNYKDSKVLPIQLAVYTDSPASIKADLDNFANVSNNSPFYDSETPSTYVQQIYNTPILLTPFDPAGNNYIHQFILSGTLLISSNVSEIKQVKIDNEILETTQRTLGYSSQVDSQRVSNAYLNQSNITYGSIQFSFQMINKNNVLANKIMGIRTGTQNIDTTFTVELTFSDNNRVETYTMKLLSVSLNSENQSLPILTIQFIK
jgi:hypothetical protein